MPNGSDSKTETRVVYISASALLVDSNSVGEFYTREHLLTCFLNPFSQLPTFREIRLQACKRFFNMSPYFTSWAADAPVTWREYLSICAIVTHFQIIQTNLQEFLVSCYSFSSSKGNS